MSFSSRHLTVLAMGLVLGGPALVAQGTQTANISGKVTTREGAPVVGAIARLTSPSLMGVRTLSTDENGVFIARLLPPGQYRIEVSKQGYIAQTHQARVGLEQTYSPVFKLAKEMGATVEVVATSAAADKTKLESSSNFTSSEIELLPTQRTQVQDVVMLSPGVVQGLNGPQIRGANSSGNLYLVDGVNYADNAYLFPRINLLFDAIEETQVLTGGISAEYGDVEGGVINSVTKSGSNEFTGQLRWDLSNPAWAGVAPYAKRPDSNLGKDLTASVGGYMLKDKLWFYVSSFSRNGGPMMTLKPTSAEGVSNASYQKTADDKRHNLKLTWTISENHTLVGSYFQQDKTEVHDYGVGELAHLNNRTENSKVVNLQLRSIFTPTLVFSGRVGVKRFQVKIKGADANGVAPMFNNDDNLYYGNAIFDDKVPTKRNMDTANFKLSYFANALGTHELDFGWDHYKGTVSGNSTQSVIQASFGGRVTQLVPWVRAVNVTNRTAIPLGLWTYDGVPGGATAHTYNDALYINDKWALNTHWNFQIGFRFDKYRGENHLGQETAHGDGLAPRLGVKYDLRGDGKWVFGLGYSRYNSRPNDIQLNRVTMADQVAEIDYALRPQYRNQTMTFEQISSLALYDPTRIEYYSDPTFNTIIAKNLEPTHIDETQASVTYSFRTAETSGFLRGTLVNKTWRNVVDKFTGQDGSKNDPSGAAVWVERVDNSPLAKRDYRGVEVDGSVAKGAWSLGGSITYSRTEGNYVGEAQSRPATASVLGIFSVWQGQQMFDPAKVSPYGPLTYDQPWKIRLNSTYRTKSGLGETTFAVMYRFDSGQRADEIRLLPGSALNPNLPAQFGSWAQYRNDQRGTITFNSTQYWDLAINHEAPIIKMDGRPVNLFGRLVIQNLWNHQQRTTWNTNYAGATTAADPWVPTSAFGTSEASSYYGTPRTILLSVGLRY